VDISAFLSTSFSSQREKVILQKKYFRKVDASDVTQNVTQPS